jgi:hypothetical protein
MKIEAAQKLSNLPTEEIATKEFTNKHQGNFVVGLVTAKDLKTHDPTHAIIMGEAEQSDSWKAWYRVESFLGEEHRGFEKIEMIVERELLLAS